MKPSTRSVARLSLYRDALKRFKSYGTEWIYSETLAETLALTAAQIRKDFSQFKLIGRKKVGYHVDTIIEQIDTILMQNIEHRAIIIGTGSLCRAIIKDDLLSQTTIKAVAVFDGSDGQEPLETGVEIQPFSQIAAYVLKNDIRLGIITTTTVKAQCALDALVLAGVKGILNLSPVDLKVPKGCALHSVNIRREAENLLYYVPAGRKKK